MKSFEIYIIVNDEEERIIVEDITVNGWDKDAYLEDVDCYYAETQRNVNDEAVIAKIIEYIEERRWDLIGIEANENKINANEAQYNSWKDRNIDEC